MEETLTYPFTSYWNQCSGSSVSACLDLKSHCLALAIAKKTLDENCFKHAQKMTHCIPSNFKVAYRVFFKKSTWQMGSKMEADYRIVCTECNRHYLHIENQATGKTSSCNINSVIHKLPVKLYNVDTTFGRAGKFINHPANLPTLFQFSLHRDPSRQGYTELWVGFIPSSFENLPYMPLMDHHYSHITR